MISNGYCSDCCCWGSFHSPGVSSSQGWRTLGILLLLRLIGGEAVSTIVGFIFLQWPLLLSQPGTWLSSGSSRSIKTQRNSTVLIKHKIQLELSINVFYLLTIYCILQTVWSILGVMELSFSLVGFWKSTIYVLSKTFQVPSFVCLFV